jgi:hypothetical protein
MEPEILLDQRLMTIPQHTWVSKLFGYDLSIEYWPGKLNTTDDTLSRRDEDGTAVRALSSPIFAVYDTLWHELSTDLQAQAIQAQLQGRTVPKGWSMVDGMLLFRGRTVP